MLSALFGNSDIAPILLWAFMLTLAIFMVVDLGFLHRKPKRISLRSATWQSVFWVAISVLYGLLIYWKQPVGSPMALEYFSAYVTEKSLSLDNIFVILLIFRYFKIDEKHYHGVLFWGILGAIFFRAFFIFTGAALIREFHWILYFFGAFLLYSGVKLLFEKGTPEVEPEKNFIYRLVNRHFRVSLRTEDGHFFVRENNQWQMTLLFLVLLLVESTDIIFAVDSIPAAFAITRNQFVIYTSNIFAIMGLRALFFLVAGVVAKFYLLQKALSIVLAFIGLKMLFEIEYFGIHIPTFWSFVFILSTLCLGLLLSLIFQKAEDKEKPSATTP